MTTSNNRSTQGSPCWYELSTPDAASAARFYGQVAGWTVAGTDVPGMDYEIASTPAGSMVAGMMSEQGAPPAWLIYFVADDVDALTEAMTADGATQIQEPTDIPGTGRFAILTDPQGAAFGLLQPAPMDEPRQDSAFDMAKQGHAGWNELMSADPEGAFTFYSKHFGWSKGETMDMGEMGTYQLLSHGGEDFGAVMGLGDAPRSNWLPYFNVDGVEQAMERIRDAGGSIHHGPHEVPGGMWIAVAQDPHQAWFAVLGPKSAK